MTTLSTLSAFLPPEALALFIGLGAIALILGARRIALTLIGLAIVGAVLPPLVEPLLDVVPGWLLALLVLHIAFALLRAALVVFIGGRAADHAVGHFVGSLLFSLFLLPLLLPYFVLRGGFALFASLIRRVL